MKAILGNRYGNPQDVLKLSDIEKPIPKKGEVLVKIKFTAINDWEWAMVNGSPKAYRLMTGLLKPKYKVVGMEMSGVVESCGPESSKFNPGDKVFGDTSDHGFGTYAEYIAISENAIMKIPQGMSFEDAAALPHAGLLAWQGLIDYGKLEHGEKVLINGGGGGVGTLGLQICHHFGATVNGVDTGPKLENMKALGFQRVMDYKKTDFVEEPEKYDLILDCKSTRSPDRLEKALSPKGRYVTVGGTPGRLLKLVLANAIGKKKIMVLPLKPNKGMDHIISLFKDGKLKNNIEGPYPLEEIPRLLKRFGDGKHTGKILVKVSEV